MWRDSRDVSHQVKLPSSVSWKDDTARRNIMCVTSISKQHTETWYKQFLTFETNSSRFSMIQVILHADWYKACTNLLKRHSLGNSFCNRWFRYYVDLLIPDRLEYYKTLENLRPLHQGLFYTLTYLRPNEDFPLHTLNILLALKNNFNKPLHSSTLF